MSIIEFENTQGINLQYTGASVFERASAFFIDAVILAIFNTIMVAISASSGSDKAVFFILVPIILFYSLIMEIFNHGQSLGKMILGLKVVRIDGRYPSGYDYLMRWMFRWIDIYLSSGSIAALLVSATPKNQRIGDMLADTTVIRTKKLRIPLERILTNKEMSSYEAKYPEVKNLKEEQVLLIKETLERYAQHKNEGHLKALNNLAQRIAILLNEEKPGNNQAFLKVVIKDYIKLTR